MLSALILSEHSYPALLLTEQLEHQRFVNPGPLVLRSEPLNSPAPTADKDRTVSRRSEPSSRTALTGEQPDPWDLLQPQDAMSRHRGAKPRRRYELLGAISLLSLAYLLSVERRQFHILPPDHLGLLSYLLDVWVSQLGWLYPCTRHPITNRAEPTFALLRYSLGGYRPSKTDRLTVSPARIHGSRLDLPIPKGGVSLATPANPERTTSKSPTYAKHGNRKNNDSVQ